MPAHVLLLVPVLNPLQDELFFCGSHFQPIHELYLYHIPSSVKFSPPKLHTSALTATSTYSRLKLHPPINELAIVTALSRQPLTQTGIKAFPLEMGTVQGERTVFSTHLCKGGQQWPTQSQPRRF